MHVHSRPFTITSDPCHIGALRPQSANPDVQAARTLFDAAAPLLAKRGATKEQRREDFLHLRTHWLETD